MAAAPTPKTTEDFAGRAGLAFGLFGFGLALGLYGWIGLGEPFDALQLVDLFTFAALTALVFLLLPRVAWIRWPLAFACGALLAACQIGFQFYYRFYQTWPTPAIFSQWRDVSGLASSFGHLLHAGDIVFGLAVPLALLPFALRSADGFRRRSAVIFFAALALTAELVFEATAVYPYLRAQNQPLLFLLREPAMERISFYLPTRQARIARVDGAIEHYYPLDADLYRFDRGKRARLRKAPLAPAPDFRQMNVIVLILESVRAFESGLYGAAESLTPVLDELGQRSLVVDSYYANAHTTVRAESAINCSVYEFANSGTIFNDFARNHLPCLPSILGERGYTTMWINSYSREFAHARGFLERHGIQQFHDIADLEKIGYTKIGWGPADEDLFRMAVDTLDRSPKPFYAEVLSLSNHYPFTQKYPTDDELPGRRYLGDYGNYRRGIYYTDYAVGRLLAGLREKPWFQDTVLVITGDHGVRFYPDDPPLSAQRKEDVFYRVPCLIHTPSGLAPVGRLHVQGAHVDIAPTIMDLLGLTAPNAFVGRSLLRVKPGEARPTFMTRDYQWNIRRGADYCYEVAHNSDVPPAFQLSAAKTAGKSPRFCFRAEGDLFHDDAIAPLPASGSTDDLFEFGQDLLAYNRFLLRRDAAYRDPREK
jgi:phosphoglycerol transferase MdoB-like AlkP superfamily enzyme